MPWRFYGTDGEPRWEAVGTTVAAGQILMYAGQPTPASSAVSEAIKAPVGYLFCNGAAVSRVTYEELFLALNAKGLPFGVGNGTTTFNLPNIRDKFVVGLNPADTDFDAIGETGGGVSHFHAVTPHLHLLLDHQHNIPNHTHDARHKHTVPSHFHGNGTYIIQNPGQSLEVDNNTPASSVAQRFHRHGINLLGTTGNSTPFFSDNSNIPNVQSPNTTATTATSAVNTDNASPNTDSQAPVPTFIPMNYIIKV